MNDPQPLRGYLNDLMNGLAVVAEPVRSQLDVWLDSSNQLTVVLTGRRRTGKTVAAQAAGVTALRAGRSVRYWHLHDLTAEASAGNAVAVNEAAEVDLLIVDDVLDTRDAGAWTLLAQTVTDRIESGKKTLIVTHDAAVFHYAEFLLAGVGLTAFSNLWIIRMEQSNGGARG